EVLTPQPCDSAVGRAFGRRELCGISAEERAIEVDHIVPRRHGGQDDLSNLQALCYRCNASKGAPDDIDFPWVREGLNARLEGCIFCKSAGPCSLGRKRARPCNTR